VSEEAALPGPPPPAAGLRPGAEPARTERPGPRPIPARPLPLPDGRPGEAAGEDPDLAVVRAIRAGGRDAFRILVEKYEKKVFSLACRTLGCGREEAADHAQEIFFKAYRGLGSFREESLFSTYLHRVAANHCVSEIRRRKAAKRGEALSLDGPVGAGEEAAPLEVPDGGPDPARRAAGREAGEAVRAAVASLEDDLRLLVVLFEQQGLSYPEIAAAVGVPVGTVRSRLHRAREILRERLRSHLG
jgi:RNA polymerase sigma-70 factor, ECF subfamily